MLIKDVQIIYVEEDGYLTLNDLEKLLPEGLELMDDAPHKILLAGMNDINYISAGFGPKTRGYLYVTKEIEGDIK
tara:strand:- start:215 stop:439 length:225 start_codon:yes stop_codon:yes gene_type:complete